MAAHIGRQTSTKDVEFSKERKGHNENCGLFYKMEQVSLLEQVSFFRKKKEAYQKRKHDKNISKTTMVKKSKCFFAFFLLFSKKACEIT